MSERAYQQDRLAQGLEPDPGLTKPGNERVARWRATFPLYPGASPGSFHAEYLNSIDFVNRLDAETFCRDMTAGSFTIEPV